MADVAETSAAKLVAKPLPDGCRLLDETVLEVPSKNRFYGPFLLPEPSCLTRQQTKNLKKKLRSRIEYLQWILDGKPSFKPACAQEVSSSFSLSHVLLTVSLPTAFGEDLGFGHEIRGCKRKRRKNRRNDRKKVQAEGEVKKEPCKVVLHVNVNKDALLLLRIHRAIIPWF